MLRLFLCLLFCSLLIAFHEGKLIGGKWNSDLKMIEETIHYINSTLSPQFKNVVQKLKGVKEPSKKVLFNSQIKYKHIMNNLNAVNSFTGAQSNFAVLYAHPLSKQLLILNELQLVHQSGASVNFPVGVDKPFKGVISFSKPLNMSLYAPTLEENDINAISTFLLFNETFVQWIDNSYRLSGCSPVISNDSNFYFLGCYSFQSPVPKQLVKIGMDPFSFPTYSSIFSVDNPHSNTIFGSAVTTDNGYTIYYGGIAYDLVSGIQVVNATGAVTIIYQDPDHGFVVKGNFNGPPRHHHDAVLYKNRFMYVFSGSLQGLDVFDIKTNNWRSIDVDISSVYQIELMHSLLMFYYSSHVNSQQLFMELPLI